MGSIEVRLPLPQCRSEMNWQFLSTWRPLKDLPISGSDDGDQTKQTQNICKQQKHEDNHD